MRAVALALAILSAALSACTAMGIVPVLGYPTPTAALPAARPTLTIALAADIPVHALIVAALQKAFGKSFALELIDFPNPPAEVPDLHDVEDRLAAARKSYVGADFAPCLASLDDAALATSLLAGDERVLAARVLFWRVACHVGAGRLADARTHAAAFATYELAVPPDVEAAAPDVETVVAQAQHAVAETPRAVLGIEDSPTVPATVSIDGRRAVCSTPCTVDVHPGDHVVRVDADGFDPLARTVRVDPGGARALFSLQPAPPELAARQWAARHLLGRSDDSAESLALLSIAARARTLAVLTFERGELRGALALDGALSARSERSTPDPAGDAPAVVRDLLVRGRLVDSGPPLWKRPLFWGLVGGAVAIAAGVTAALLYHPDTHTKVSF